VPPRPERGPASGGCEGPGTGHPHSPPGFLNRVSDSAFRGAAVPVPPRPERSVASGGCEGPGTGHLRRPVGTWWARRCLCLHARSEMRRAEGVRGLARVICAGRLCEGPGTGHLRRPSSGGGASIPAPWPVRPQPRSRGVRRGSPGSWPLSPNPCLR